MLKSTEDSPEPLSAERQRLRLPGESFRIPIVLLAFALFLVRDEVRFPASVPLQSSQVATVPLFNLWTIGWNADRAANGLKDYWQAPIFFPTESSFAFSEPQPATLFISPVVRATGSAVTGYKVWLFLSLFLNGLVTSVLLRRIGYGRLLQLAGGLALMLLPVVHQRIDVLQLVPVWGILWFWSCLFALARQPRLRSAGETAVAFVMCFALCVHHALFLCLLTPFAALVFVPLLRDRRFALAVSLAAVTGAILILPIVLPIHEAAARNGFSRQEQIVRGQSATLDQYLATPATSLIQFEGLEGQANRQFNVGWIRMTLAVGGVVFGLWHGERRRWLLFLLVTGVASLVFSLGLNLEVFGWKPWQTLSSSVPGVAQVRNVYRFVWFLQITVILLGVEWLALMQRFCDRRFMASSCGRARKVAVFTGLVVLPGVLLVGEVWPEVNRRGGVPDVNEHAGWLRFIRENRSEGRPIACLPFSAGNSVQDFDVTTRWMCYGLEHGAPMVNGYSGFFPASYFRLRNRVNREFPSVGVLDDFAALDVEFLVVSRTYCEPERLLAVTSDTRRLELVFQDGVGIDVYRLRPPAGGSTHAIR